MTKEPLGVLSKRHVRVPLGPSKDTLPGREMGWGRWGGEGAEERSVAAN